jgi:tRNA(adenine34) deaminase
LKTDHDYMEFAILAAKQAANIGEVPVGAVVVAADGTLLGEGYNLRESLQDPTAHAEILAVKQAATRIGSWRLEDSTLYVTLEPCPMCAGALVNSRIKRLVYGCKDPKAGAVDSLFDICRDSRLNHRVEVISGVREEECSNLLRTFFSDLREQKKKAKISLKAAHDGATANEED